MSRGRFRTPRWNARPREGERRCLWSPRLLGGLAGGRVRSRKSRGIPKKRSSSRHSFPGSSVLNICNISTGEIGSEKRSPFLKLQNLLFNLIAPRVQNSYKNQLFFIDSEKHIKSSLRTSSKKNFKNDSKNNEILKSIVFSNRWKTQKHQ